MRATARRDLEDRRQAGAAGTRAGGGGDARPRRPHRRGSSSRWPRPRRRSRRRCWSCPTCRIPTCRSGRTRAPTWSCARSARRRLRLRAAAALGPRPGARHHRLRARREDLRLALLRAAGAGARLQRALISWMLDLHVGEHGYTRDLPAGDGASTECLSAPASCPSSATTCTATPRRTSGSCRPPRCRSPTCTATRSSSPGSLPIHHVAYTPCFRREKMSAGRDVRGIKRGHQFDKVEMVKFVAPETSDAELERCSTTPRTSAARLGLRHRVVQMCTGDLSFVGGDEVRRRGVGAGLRRVARGQLLLQLPRLPGAPRRASAIGRAPRRQAGVRAHPERLRPGPAAGDDRRARDLPAGRRQRR